MSVAVDTGWPGPPASLAPVAQPSLSIFMLRRVVLAEQLGLPARQISSDPS